MHQKSPPSGILNFKSSNPSTSHFPWSILQIILQIQKPISLQFLQLPPLPQPNTIPPIGIQYDFRMFISIETASIISMYLGFFKENDIPCEGIKGVYIAPD